MLLNRVEVQNFLSFGPAQELDLSHCGLMLVEGKNCDDAHAQSNGAGKSAVGEAVFWALFGRTLRGIKGDAVINERVGKDCRVAVLGQQHGLNFAVVRARKLSVNPCPLTFHVDGDDRTAGNDSAETQKRIEAFTGYTADVFAHTVVFGQGAAWRFTELNDAERKALLDKLLGMERIGRAHMFVRAKLAEVAADLSTHQAAYAALTTRRDEAKQLYKDLRAERRAYVSQQRGVLRERLARLQERLGAIQPADPDPELPQRIREEESRIAELATSYDDKVGEHAKAEAHKAQLERELGEAARTLKRMGKASPGQPCTLCGAVMQAAQLAQCIQGAKDTVAKLTQDVSAANLWEKTQRSERAIQAKVLADARQALRVLERQMCEDQRLQASRAMVQSLRADHDAVRVELASLATPKPQAAEQRAKAVWYDGRVQAKECRRQVRTLQGVVDHLAFWGKGFGPGGIKSHLLDHVTPLLNHHAGVFARQLTSNVSIEFQSQATLKTGEQRDKLTLVVTNTCGATGYEGASQGERRKIDIVVALALQSLLQGERKCNLAVWDEVFESLDETSAEAVMGLLRHEASTKSSTLVISHADWLKSHFPHSLTVVKEGGFSRIEIG